MIILAIDPSTRHNGWALIEDAKSTVLKDYGCLTLSPNQSMQKRLHTIYAFFEGLITTRSVTRLAIETPFFLRNYSTFMKLSCVRGILYLLAEEYSLELSEYSPCEVKQAITGNGHAKKDQVANALYGIFPGLDKETISRDDITDAIAVGVTSVWRS